jgi:hypothetical protein
MKINPSKSKAVHFTRNRVKEQLNYSRSKFSSNIIDCIHVIYSMPSGENPIADNKYYYYKDYSKSIHHTAHLLH